MYVKIVATLLTLMLAVSLSAQVRTITVDDDGPADFRSIQAAIDAAQPGDTIQVAPGLYRESLLIDKNDLSIIGAGREVTIIEGTDIVVSFAVVGSGLLKGFTLRYAGSEPRAAVWIFSADPTLEENVITGATLSGIEAREGAAPVIRGNLIQGHGENGILLASGARPEIVGNTIVGNGMNGDFSGIEVREAADPLIQGNFIAGNRGHGVSVHSEASGEIRANTILLNGSSGIAVVAADPLLSDNTLLWNGVAGLALGEAAQPTVTGNFVARHPVGVFAESAQPALAHNLVLDNETDYQGVEPPDNENQLKASIPQPELDALRGTLSAVEERLSALEPGTSVESDIEILAALQQLELSLGGIYERRGFELWTPSVFTFSAADPNPLLLPFVIDALLQAAKQRYQKATVGPDPALSAEAERKLAQVGTLTSASIVFGEADEEHGISLQQGGAHDTQVVTVGDPPRAARRTGNGQVLPARDGNQIPDRYMQFDVDDALLFNAQPTPRVMIAVEFLDAGTDSFTIEYDAQGIGGPFGDGRFTSTPAVTKTDTGAWRWALFVLDDALFANRDDGGDFRIDDLTDGAEIINSAVVLWLKPGS